MSVFVQNDAEKAPRLGRFVGFMRFCGMGEPCGDAVTPSAARPQERARATSLSEGGKGSGAALL